MVVVVQQRQCDAERRPLALKTPYDDGTSHVVLCPMEFIGRLAALAWPAASKAEGEPHEVSWVFLPAEQVESACRARTAGG